MRFILKLKHWQVFLILLLASLTSNFTWEGEELINSLLNLSGLIIYFFWFFSVGLELTNHLPQKIELPRTLFIINAFFLVTSIAILNLVFGGEFSSNGLLGFLWILYLGYALFQFIFYPNKALRAIELRTEATFGDYFKYVFLTILWPIGIWWIQPKLNRIAADNKR